MERSYILETNRAVGDNIRVVARRLIKAGVDVTILPHKTSMAIIRPAWMTWSEFTTLLRSMIQSIGSLMLFSQSTGNVFICSNRGNRPGEFVKYGAE